MSFPQHLSRGQLRWDRNSGLLHVPLDWAAPGEGGEAFAQEFPAAGTLRAHYGNRPECH